MSLNTYGNLRARLRAETQDVHEKLDNALGFLDVSETEGQRLFLKGNAYAFAELIGHSSTARDLLIHRLKLANEDLASFGVSPVEIRFPAGEVPLDELGVSYVVAGSHLGAKVLMRRWNTPTEKKFLSDGTLPNLWRSVLEALSVIPANGSRADAVVESAKTCFEYFERGFARAQAPGMTR